MVRGGDSFKEDEGVHASDVLINMGSRIVFG